MEGQTKISSTLIWVQCARLENGKVLLTHTISEVRVSIMVPTLKEERHLYYGGLLIGLIRFRGLIKF
jgi:hypothetical protein